MSTLDQPTNLPLGLRLPAFLFGCVLIFGVVNYSRSLWHVHQSTPVEHVVSPLGIDGATYRGLLTSMGPSVDTLEIVVHLWDDSPFLTFYAEDPSNYWHLMTLEIDADGYLRSTDWKRYGHLQNNHGDLKIHLDLPRKDVLWGPLRFIGDQVPNEFQLVGFETFERTRVPFTGKRP